MQELNDIENSAKAVAKRGIKEEIQKLISFLKDLLSTLGGKEDPAPAPQKPDPESRPAPKRDVILEGILRDRKRANSSFAFSKDRPLKDSW
jgi:hypothetical protein